MAKVDTRTLTPSELETLRRRAIALVDSGLSQAAAAREVGVRAATMSIWMGRYRRKGSDGLVDQKRGKPKVLLTPRQGLLLRKRIEVTTPGQLRLDFALWTADAVLTLIQTTYDKIVARSTVRRLLFSWGFTLKKGTRRAWHQDNVEVARWVTSEYPAIAARAKKEKGRIFWADETGLRSDEGTTVRRSPVGESAIMAANGRGWFCNVISATDNEGGLAFQVFKGGFKIPVFIGFLNRLIQHGKGRKIFLMLDQHPVHRAAKVKKWVEARQDQIEIFFMPGYSPELNPDEYHNNDLKGQTVRNRPPKDGEHLIV